jgi:YHS domain-containing protein
MASFGLLKSVLHKEKVMKKLISFLIILSISISIFAFAEEINLKPQTVCPELGGKINKKIYMDYQGQRVYFCCPPCKEAFQKEPDKYLEKLSEDKVQLEAVH